MADFISPRLQLKVAVVSRQPWVASKAVPALQHRGGAPWPIWVLEADRSLGVQQHLEPWRVLMVTHPPVYLFRTGLLALNFHFVMVEKKIKNKPKTISPHSQHENFRKKQIEELKGQEVSPGTWTQLVLKDVIGLGTRKNA